MLSLRSYSGLTRIPTRPLAVPALPGVIVIWSLDIAKCSARSGAQNHDHECQQVCVKPSSNLPPSHSRSGHIDSQFERPKVPQSGHSWRRPLSNSDKCSKRRNASSGLCGCVSEGLYLHQVRPIVASQLSCDFVQGVRGVRVVVDEPDIIRHVVKVAAGIIVLLAGW